MQSAKFATYPPPADTAVSQNARTPEPKESTTFWLSYPVTKRSSGAFSLRSLFSRRQEPYFYFCRISQQCQFISQLSGDGAIPHKSAGNYDREGHNEKPKPDAAAADKICHGRPEGQSERRNTERKGQHRSGASAQREAEAPSIARRSALLMGAPLRIPPLFLYRF